MNNVIFTLEANGLLMGCWQAMRSKFTVNQCSRLIPKFSNRSQKRWNYHFVERRCWMEEGSGGQPHSGQFNIQPHQRHKLLWIPSIIPPLLLECPGFFSSTNIPKQIPTTFWQKRSVFIEKTSTMWITEICLTQSNLEDLKQVTLAQKST